MKIGKRIKSDVPENDEIKYRERLRKGINFGKIQETGEDEFARRPAYIWNIYGRRNIRWKNYLVLRLLIKYRKLIPTINIINTYFSTKM
jgi:hypothetical protein